MHEIIEYLYLGGLVDATNLDLLKRAKVVAIVNCCTPVEVPASARVEGIEYFGVDVEDVGIEPIDTYFHDAADFINRHVLKKEAVLIHCKSGVSRSATVAIAYLVIKKNFDLQEAFFHVRAKRDVVCPNIGFMSQLCKLESEVTNSAEAAATETQTAANSSPDIYRTADNSVPEQRRGMQGDADNTIGDDPSSSSASRSTSSTPSGHLTESQSDTSHSSDVSQPCITSQSDINNLRHPLTTSYPSQPSSKSVNVNLKCPSESSSQSPVSSSRALYSSQSLSTNSSSHDLPSTTKSFPSKFLDHNHPHSSSQQWPSAYPAMSNVIRVEVLPDNRAHDLVIHHSARPSAAIEQIHSLENGPFSSIGNSVLSTANLEFTPLRPSTSSHSRRRNSRRQDDSKAGHKPKKMRKRRKSLGHDTKHNESTEGDNLMPSTTPKGTANGGNDKLDGIAHHNIDGAATPPKAHKDVGFHPTLPPVRKKGPSLCMDKYIDWYIADASYRAAVPDLDP